MKKIYTKLCPYCNTEMERCEAQSCNFYWWNCEVCKKSFTKDYLKGFADGKKWEKPI